jgi:hypothetical protein
VLGYLSEAGRRQFAATVGGLDAVWLANEPAGATSRVPAGDDAAFLLVRDGREVLAVTDPHGTWLRWLS